MTHNPCQQILKTYHPYKSYEESVSYDVESFFTNISINWTIDYRSDIQ